MLALDQVIAVELFLGFRERPIGNDRLAVFLANRDVAGGSVQRCARQQSSAGLEFMDEIPVCLQNCGALRIREF
jgi:hypothetical protein